MSDKNDMTKEQIKTYTKHLEKRIRNLETEKQLLDAERLRLEQELHSLRNEIDRLREPPLVTAVVVATFDNKIVVLSTTGPAFVVHASRKMKGKVIMPGMFVAVNQRTFAVMDIIPVTSDQMKNAKEKITLTEYTWKKAKSD